MPTRTTPAQPRYSGRTPNGAGFTLKPYSLQWEAHDGVGPISVPLTADAPLAEIANHIRLHGCVANDHRRYINT